jgi:IS4 transposase
MDGQDLTQRLGAMLLGRFAHNNPLAASVRLVLEQIVVPAQLNALFEKHSERQYTRKILFSSIVQVMLAVVSGRVDAPLAAMKRQGDAFKASFSAFYEKIAGTETAVSAALVAHSFAQGRALLVEMGGLRAEPLPGWRLRILDGNRIAASERRLQPLWGVVAGPLPGLALVAFDVAAMMMSDVILCEDGHASERSLVGEILALIAKGDCWIADRNFCTYDILFGVMKREAAFVIRHHAGMAGEPVGPRRALGRCATGRLFEQSYQLRHGEETRTVRRITVVLDKPTRDKEIELHILSSLPPEVSAETIASLYNARWTIESAFGDLSRWLDAELKPLGYPRAALLGSCVGLLAYNVVSTVLGALRATHGETFVCEQVSGYYIAQFGREAVGGVVDATIEEEEWAAWRTLSAPAAAALLKATAARISPALIRKSKRGPKTKTPKRTRYKTKTHVSTKKILDGTCEEDG